MANCGYCSAELKFMNTPNFGGGYLKTGERLCRDCFGKLIRQLPGVRTGKLTLDEVKNELDGPKLTITVTKVSEPQIDVADQIAKLAALNTQGILTDEEFNAQKKKLLGL